MLDLVIPESVLTQFEEELESIVVIGEEDPFRSDVFSCSCTTGCGSDYSRGNCSCTSSCGSDYAKNGTCSCTTSCGSNSNRD